MRIRTYITILIIGCGLSALGLFKIAQNTNTRVEKLQTQLGSTQLAQSDFSRIEDQFNQWLVLNDIVFGNHESYLIQGGIKVGENIQDLTAKIKRTKILDPTAFDPLDVFIEGQLGRLESATSFNADDWESKGSDLLYEMDDQSYTAIDSIDLIRNTLESKIASLSEGFANASQKRDSVTIFAATGFIVIVGALWTWTVFTISRPIRKLSKTASESLEREEAFSLEQQGPKEIKALNSSFTSLVDSLESKVAKRTAQFKRAAKEAQTADKAKSEFLASMSHEIRTPMNGIIGMNDLILEHTTDRDTQHYAETVRSSADTLLVLINQILDFSKIDAGQLELENEPFNLRHTIEEVINLFTPAANARGIDIFYKLSPTTHYLFEGDSHRLKQVLSNLVGNAVKFTEKGSISISITSVSDSDESTSLSFEVKDTGIGIPESAREKLFNTFTQADSSTTRKFGGTGLGLAISKNLVHLMKGEIGFESEVGLGSNFHFTATFKKNFDHEQEMAIATAAKELKGKRAILLLEKPHLVENVTPWLESWDMEVFVARNGEDLANQVAESEFQLAIVDTSSIKLFESDIKACKAFENGTKLTLLSQSPCNSATKNTSLSGRIDHCLTLPFKPISLLRELTQSDIDTSGYSQRESSEESNEATAILSCSILLVDDNQTNRSVVKSILKRHEIKIDEAINGREAVKSASITEYDVILMDCMMPEMDGYEATAAIRLDELCPNQRTPIIALTANAMSGDREKCLAAGMNDYLSKPIRAQSLQATLTNWTSNSPQPARSTFEPISALDPTQLFDHVSFIDNTGGYDNEMKELLREFIETATKSTSEITNMCESEKDPNKIAVQSHSLKGCAANIGANALCNVANTIEEACASEQISAIKALLPSLIETLNATIPAIESFIDKTPTD